MIRAKFFAVMSMACISFAASCLNAATIPAGTILMVRTVNSISSNDPVGRTFAAQVDQDVDVKGKALLKAGTKAFGRIQSSRANPRRSEPFALELTSISVNGRKVALKTYSVEPGSTPTAAQVRHGVSVGTVVVQPGTKMQFQLSQAVTL